MNILWPIVFLLLPIAGVTYVGWHAWHILPFAACWRWTVVCLLVLCLLCLVPVMTGVAHSMPLSLASAAYEVGTSSIFVLLYMVMLFLLLDIGRLAHFVPSSFLHNSVAGSITVAAIIIGVFTYGYFNYKHKVRVPLELTTSKTLPKKDMTIVMASDLHLGYHNRVGELRRWVDLINAENPDLVLIAGDIIDISVLPVLKQDMASELRRIKAPVYASLGNHEYFSGMQAVRAFYKDAGIHLLIDSVASVDGLTIIGRDDRTNPHRKTLKELAAQADGGSYTIVLDHQPYHLEEAEQAEMDFQFSGHTHRGQVWPISWITDAIYEQSCGPWQRGFTRYYVSSGLGIWGGMFRIGTRSEYVVATLSGV